MCSGNMEIVVSNGGLGFGNKEKATDSSGNPVEGPEYGKGELSSELLIVIKVLFLGVRDAFQLVSCVP